MSLSRGPTGPSPQDFVTAALPEGSQAIRYHSRDSGRESLLLRPKPTSHLSAPPRSVQAQRVLVVAPEDTVSGLERPGMVMIDIEVATTQTSTNSAFSHPSEPQILGTATQPETAPPPEPTPPPATTLSPGSATPLEPAGRSKTVTWQEPSSGSLQAISWFPGLKDDLSTDLSKLCRGENEAEVFTRRYRNLSVEESLQSELAFHIRCQKISLYQLVEAFAVKRKHAGFAQLMGRRDGRECVVFESLDLFTIGLGSFRRTIADVGIEVAF
jgi:hypothetical protein